MVVFNSQESVYFSQKPVCCDEAMKKRRFLLENERFPRANDTFFDCFPSVIVVAAS